MGDSLTGGPRFVFRHQLCIAARRACPAFGAADVPTSGPMRPEMSELCPNAPRPRCGARRPRARAVPRVSRPTVRRRSAGAPPSVPSAAMPRAAAAASPVSSGIVSSGRVRSGVRRIAAVGRLRRSSPARTGISVIVTIVGISAAVTTGGISGTGMIDVPTAGTSAIVMTAGTSATGMTGVPTVATSATVMIAGISAAVTIAGTSGTGTTGVPTAGTSAARMIGVRAARSASPVRSSVPAITATTVAAPSAASSSVTNRATTSSRSWSTPTRCPGSRPRRP